MKNICKPALLLLFFFSSAAFARTVHYSNVYNEVPLLHQRVEQLSRNKVSDFFIFSHGRPGALLLMGEWKDAKQIAAWLKTRIDLKIKAVRIFGCEFGKGEKGKAAVDYLQRALNVTVSASDNITGKDGDWTLETGAPYTMQGLDDYAFNLQCGGIAGGTNAADDFDGDGICNGVDTDDDNDGVPDVTERSTGGVPLYQSFWGVKVYDYPSEDDTLLHSSEDFGPLTQVASGTMMNAPNSLDLFWINRNARADVLPTLNESGGNITGTNPLTNNYAVYFVHTFTAFEAGWYTIEQGDLRDGKHIYKTKSDGTDSTIFESKSWIERNATVTIYFEPGSKLNLFIWENGSNDTRAVINIRPSPGQEFYADIDTDNDGFPNYLDLDSDGDGCSDAYEAGATNNTAGNYRFTGAVGTNGLVNSLETATDNGVINYTSTYSLYAVYTFLNLCADTDRDGIPDMFEDMDDDNDGVPDAIESPGCFYTATEANSTLKISSQFISPDDDQTDGDIQLLHDGVATIKTFNFNAYTTAQNPTGSNLFTIAYSTPVKLATIAVSDNISSTTDANAVVVGSNDGVTWSPALSPATVITTTPVTFTIATAQAYRYYKIQTGSTAGALATGNTIGEITSTLANDYNPSAHPKNNCADDADGDKIFNILELDSDNDGCSDAYEAGATTNTASNYQFTGAVGTNGLVNSVETATDNGVVNYTSTYNLYAVYTLLNLCADTDGDNIPDVFEDIDDDNDGVPDAVESPHCFYTAMEANVILKISSGFTSPDDDQNDGDIQLLHDGDATVKSFNFNAYTTAQNPTGSNLFTIAYSTPVKLTAITLSDNISSTATANAVVVGSNNGITWSAALSPATLITTAPLTFTISTTQAYQYYKIQTGSTAGALTTNNTIGEITSTLAGDYNPSEHPKATCINDTDGDSAFNHLDVDSDGDNCSDAKEAGAASSTATNYRFTGPVGTNGLDNTLETAPDNGIINYTSMYDYAIESSFNVCADADGEGIGNIIDIDDDNDGVLDAVESPACFYTATEANSILKISSQFASPDDDQSDRDIQLLHDGITTTKTFNFNAYTTAQNPTGSNLFTIAYPTPVKLTTLTVSDDISTTTNANAVVVGSNDGVTWSAALSPATVITTTPVTFTIGTTVAYKYYSIQTGSVAGALVTGNTIGEITSTLAGNYNPSEHPKAACANDTDGDSALNHFDLDSDGDDCYDLRESGITGGYSDSLAVNPLDTAATPVGTNGFRNSLETAEDGIYNGTYTYNYATGNNYAKCKDSDGDNVFDVEDLDDDNDGITDATESESCFYTSAEANTIAKITSQFVSVDDDQSDGDIQMLHDADAATKSFNFNAYTTAQNPMGSNLFTIAYSTPVKLTTLAVSDNISSTANANAVVVGSGDGTTWSAALSPATLITTTPVTFTISTAQPYQYYKIQTGSVTGALATANTIGEITSTLAGDYNPSAHPKNSCTVDTDGDRILNQSDLDSDGDNCSDAVEAGVARSAGSPTMEPGVLKNKDSEVKVSNAVVSGPYGNNGFANSIETSAESGVYNSTYTYSKATDGYPVSDCAARFAVMPVRMLGFTAKAANKTVWLNWITSNEVNNQYFDIERSANGNSWSAIGRVEGKNRPGVHVYEFADMNALNGASYYRLRQKDFDGKYVYSEVRAVNNSIESPLQLYPNPAQNYIVISTTNLRRTDIAVYDASGKNLTPLLRIKQSGSAEFFINIEVLTTGLYILKAKGKTISFVKS